MRGPVCLQGGGELVPATNGMDGMLVARCGGPVAVLPLASGPGDYDRTAAQGVSHFRRLGAEAVAVPDPRESVHGVQDVLEQAALVVLPGGSPSRLVSGLAETGLGQVLAALVEAGTGVMGASAGAMVLGEWLVLPEERNKVVPGLGLAGPVAVLPHWDGPRPTWERALAKKGVTVLGIPERSGVLLDDGVMAAMGERGTRVLADDTELSVGARRSAP